MAAFRDPQRVSAMARIGVISDTHGLLRPEALAALQGVDHIVHAGDVGKPEILPALRAIAPVSVVRGNVDVGPWASPLPETAATAVGGTRIYVLHDLAALAIDPVAEGIDVVIYGHSHRPTIERRGRVLYLNPGSAGPRRFSLPVTVALLTVDRGRLEAVIVPLPIAP